MTSLGNVWLKKNGQDLRIPHEVPSILLPWNPGRGLNETRLRRELLTSRPVVKGYKNIRVCKDVVYYDAITQACIKNMTHGNYLGLAAAHMPEIYTALNTFIKRRFDTCQLGKSDYKMISDYIPQVNNAYRYSSRTRFGNSSQISNS
jgi:hypothetical protein